MHDFFAFFVSLFLGSDESESVSVLISPLFLFASSPLFFEGLLVNLKKEVPGTRLTSEVSILSGVFGIALSGTSGANFCGDTGAVI